MTDQLQVPAEITLYLRALLAAGCREAVERVRDAPDEKWRTDSPYDHGTRCLVGHAEDWNPTVTDQRAYDLRIGTPGLVFVWRVFQGWAPAVGLPLAADALRAEAGRLLEQAP